MLTLPSEPRLVLDNNHCYFYDRVQVPSPTMLFSEEELSNISDIPEDILVWKTGLGKAVHFACHLLDTGRLGEIDPAIEPYLNAYKKFKSDTDFEPKLSEQILYSRKWRFATTIDRMGFFSWRGKSGQSIIELKCTLGMYPTTGPQTAAHKIAVEENVPQVGKIQYRYGLQLLKSGDYKVHEYLNPQDETTFLSCLNLYHWKVANKIIKPKRMEN